MTREFLESLMQMPEAVAQAILQEHENRRQEWEAKVHDARLDGAVDSAIARAGGRNHKAITALLDMQALRGAEDLQAAARQAVEAIKKECGYLFETAPAYAPGTGGVQGQFEEEPQTLAGALREKFGK